MTTRRAALIWGLLLLAYLATFLLILFLIGNCNTT